MSGTASHQKQIRVLRCRAEIEALRDFWTSHQLFRDADLDYYLFFAERNPETVRPHVVVVYEDDLPKALLAGRLDVSRMPIKIGHFPVPLPRMRIFRFVHGGWLGEMTVENAELLVQSIIESLATGGADAAMLYAPPLNSPLVFCARKMPQWWCSEYQLDSRIHRVRDLPATPDLFVQSLSPHARATQRKRARELAQNFRDYRVIMFSTPDEVDKLMRDAEVVAKTSWQRAFGGGFLSTPLTRACLEFEATKGWLTAYILYVDRNPVAFWMGTLRNRSFLSGYTAYDPAYAKYRPGTYLMLKVMEEFCSISGVQRVDTVDFGIGDSSWKERFANRSWPESNVHIYAPTLKAVAFNGLRTTAGFVNRSGDRVLRGTRMLGKPGRGRRSRSSLFLS